VAGTGVKQGKGDKAVHWHAKPGAGRQYTAKEKRGNATDENQHSPTGPLSPILAALRPVVQPVLAGNISVLGWHRKKVVAYNAQSPLRTKPLNVGIVRENGISLVDGMRPVIFANRQTTPAELACLIDGRQ
jgi:hypothetical protein